MTRTNSAVQKAGTWEELKKLRGDPSTTPEYWEEQAALQFGRILRHLRTGSKLTQVDLSERLRVSQSEVARLESGAFLPTFSVLLQAAGAFDRQVVVAVKDGNRTQHKWVVKEAPEAAGIVRDLRTQSGLSQAALADSLGTHQSNVARFENPSSVPQMRTLSRVVRAIGGGFLVVGLVHGKALSNSTSFKL